MKEVERRIWRAYEAVFVLLMRMKTDDEWGPNPVCSKRTLDCARRLDPRLSELTLPLWGSVCEQDVHNRRLASQCWHCIVSRFVMAVPSMASGVESWRQGPGSNGATLLSMGVIRNRWWQKLLSKFSVDTPRYRYYEHVGIAYCALWGERGKQLP